MLDDSLVSVVVSTFNVEQYVERALESVLKQRVSFPIEIVVGDDGSSDSTRAILAECERRHPDRLRLLLPQANMGAGGSRMTLALFHESRGDLVALLDGDDEWLSVEKLAKQVEFMRLHPECVASFHNALVAASSDDPAGWSLRPEGSDGVLSLRELLGDVSIQNSTLMFRRSLIQQQERWLADLPIEELSDWAMAVLATRCGSVGYLSAVLSLYRQQIGGAWSSRGRTSQLEEVLRRYDVLRRVLGGHGGEACGEAAGLHAWELAREHEKRGEFRAAADAIKRCVAEHPQALEDNLPGEGYFGTRVWSVLRRRAWVYGLPEVGRLAFKLRRAVELCLWWQIRITTWAREVARQRRIFSKVRFDIEVVESEAHRPGGLAVARVSWFAPGTTGVKLHVGSPAGPLITHGGPEGTFQTGSWVHDRMLFVLQDADEATRTLAVVRVRLPRAWHGTV